MGRRRQCVCNANKIDIAIFTVTTLKIGTWLAIGYYYIYKQGFYGEGIME